MISQGRTVFVEAIQLTQDYTTAWPNNIGLRAFPITFARGAVLEKIGDYQGAGLYTGPSIGGPQTSDDRQLLVPHGLVVESNGMVTHVYGGGIIIPEEPGRTVGFERTQIAQDAGPNFKKEFIYSGRNQDSFFFTYREFVNDVVRPAFTQNVTYNIKDGKEIGFKSLRLRVLDATNTEITYELLNPF